MNGRNAVALLILLAPALGHAAPRSRGITIADVQPLGNTAHSVIAAQAQVLASSGMQPAPMPNPDFDPPHGDGATLPNLTPALLSSKVEFQGNGFSRASNLDYGVDQRTRPAAGLNWSVPVK